MTDFYVCTVAGFGPHPLNFRLGLALAGAPPVGLLDHGTTGINAFLHPVLAGPPEGQRAQEVDVI